MTDRPAVNERIAARRAEVRAERRRRRLRRTITVAVLVVVALGAVALERSSLVALASIEVQGLERLDEATVLDAGGVSAGTSVLRLRLDTIRERLVALPLVDDALVERDGALGLRIIVDEAAPALTAAYGETRLLVSEDGLVLGEGSAPGTPLVVVARGRAPAPGDRTSEAPVLDTARRVVLGLPGPIAALVERTRAVSPDTVELVLEGGTVVRWGDAARADEKARALGAVLEDLGTRTVTSIDVRAPAAPTIAP